MSLEDQYKSLGWPPIKIYADIHCPQRMTLEIQIII